MRISPAKRLEIPILSSGIYLWLSLIAQSVMFPFFGYFQICMLVCSLSGLKKNGLLNFYLKLSRSNTEAELQLLEKRQTSPELFIDRPPEHLSKLYLSKTCSQSNLMELISSLDVTNISVYKDGADSTFLDLVEGFEWLFNTRFNNCYEMRRRILMRKTQKTPFLDKLKYMQTRKMNL
nr:MAG TPA: RteC protein [Caudoviricetes sp.]